jgi:hypothetical protein
MVKLPMLLAGSTVDGARSRRPADPILTKLKFVTGYDLLDRLRFPSVLHRQAAPPETHSDSPPHATS